MRCPICDGEFVKVINHLNTFQYTFSPHNTPLPKSMSCENMSCSSKGVGHNFHISIEENHWFAVNYNIPFRAGDKFYSIKGPEKFWKDGDFSAKTIMEEIMNINNPGILGTYGSLTFGGNPTIPPALTNNTIQTAYYALPVNEDFNREFNLLVAKLMGLMALK